LGSIQFRHPRFAQGDNLNDPASGLQASLSDRYRIERELGRGGMATVYLAHDLRQERLVALKVIHPELTATLGPERFLREIKLTANLRHPHILPLFDSGEAGGFLYYVMPYIQGETIREKLNRETQFGVDEALRIAREVADALDYAHRRGVIHRDIKPENILLHDGRAMVMDFGIALAVSAAAGGRMTETGLSLGTPHYMSPEQATAEKEITPRSDIYSLASVLYEMLSGQPPHIGGSAQQVIMKIIVEQARPVNQLRRSVAANVVAALEKALEKLPADRFENAKAFGDALASGNFSYATTAATAVGMGSAAGSRLGGRYASLAGWAVAIIALAIAGGVGLRGPAEQSTRRLDLSLSNLVVKPSSDIAISPDGTMLAAAATAGDVDGIFIRHLDGDPEFRKVPGTDGGTYPAFSPDNQWIVFRRLNDRALVKINVSGGGAMVLVDGSSGLVPFFPHWGDDDRIVFSGPNGSGIVSASGGNVTPLPKASGLRPFLLPDGSGVLFSTTASIALFDFKSDSSITLFAGRNPVYTRTGHLLYSSLENGLFAVPFDLKRRRVTGPPVRVLERVAATTAMRGYAVSREGTVVQHDAAGSSSGGNSVLVIVDPGRGADTVRLPRGRYGFPRFSPDGRRIAMEAGTERANNTDIYTIDLVTGTFTQHTFAEDNDEPAWSPDGKTIAYDRVVNRNSGGNSQGEDLFLKPADNSGPERRVSVTMSSEVSMQQWLDNKRLLFSARGASGSDANDIFTISIDSGSQPVEYARTPFGETEPRVSPDGKLIVYVSTETGAPQLWMRDFPVPQGKWNLSRQQARGPRWTPDGKAVLFWRTGGISPAVDSLFRVRIDRTPGIVVHDVQLVATLDVNGIQHWDLHPDGRRFVTTVAEAAAPTRSGAPERYLIIENWFSELRRLTAGKAK
jgi:serine/threonine-protein kinase